MSGLSSRLLSLLLQVFSFKRLFYFQHSSPGTSGATVVYLKTKYLIKFEEK